MTEKTKEYDVLSPVRKDKLRYIDGTIELTKEEHRELSAIGAVSKEPASSSKQKTDERIVPDSDDAILAGLTQLTDADLKKDGMPKADALDRIFTQRPDEEKVKAAMEATSSGGDNQ